MSEICPVCNRVVEPHDAACPHCGFKLLGSTQRFDPVTFPEETLDETDRPVQDATLRVVRGPQTGISFRLGNTPLSIGRSPQCDVFLNDMTVSREHASLTPDGGGYVINDENSFNGVWVNSDSVDTRRLASGDVVQIGAFCLLYQEG